MDMVVPMLDELFQRYRSITHPELYRMLRDGSPRQVEELATAWGSIADTINGLAMSLRQDLDRLLPHWTGHASQEFHDRLGLVAQFAQVLADEASAIRTGLSTMANALADAQRQAEPPPDGAGFIHNRDSLLGQALGYVPAVEAVLQAHERIVRVVASLASEYGSAVQGSWPVSIPNAPSGLPLRELINEALGKVGSGLAGVGPIRHGTRGPSLVESVVRTVLPPRSGPDPITALLPGVAGVPSQSRNESTQNNRPGVTPGIPAPSGNAVHTGHSGLAAPSSHGNASGVERAATAAPTPSHSETAVPMAPMAGVAPVPAAAGGPAGAHAHLPLDADTVMAGDLTWQSTENMHWGDADDDAPPSVLSD